MTFLPQDYKGEPTTSNYMSFAEGANTFRVLGSAKVGWEYWTEEIINGEKKNRPHRVTKEEGIPVEDVVLDKYGNPNFYYFWAFPVYNFNDRRIQILNAKQKTVRKGIEKYLKNEKWGDPKQYNLEVTRAKTPDGKTEYSVLAEPKDELDPDIIKQYEEMNIDMNVWMEGGDPFLKSDKMEA